MALLSELSATNPVAVSENDFSGTITNGGQSQSALAANANRKALIIGNPSNQGESLLYNFGGDATLGTAIELLPGKFDVWNGVAIPTQSVSVNAATTNHPFVLKEFA